MAKHIVVQLPEGSPLEKMKPEEIQKFVKQATAHLPKADHKNHAEQVVIQTGEKAMKPLGIGPWVQWTRAC